MWKKLILFCTFAIFMLAIGGAVTSVWAHDACDEAGGKGKHSPDHPHCNQDTGSTNDGSLYLVWVDGVCKTWWSDGVNNVCGDRKYGVCADYECTEWVDGVCVDSQVVDVCQWDDEDWVDYDLGIPPYSGHDPVGKKEAVTVNFHHIDMDLSFFQDYFDANGAGTDDGFKCFAEAPRVGGQTVLTIEHDSAKGKDKDTALVAWYVFGGFGTDGITNFSYRLKLWSEEHPHFLSGWRPTAKNDPFSVEFDHWELSSQNDIACTGTDSLDTIMTISIEKTN